MKLALIFLSALVVISHQQFQQARRMYWMPQRLGNYYQQEPYYYDNADDGQLYRQLRPSLPLTYSQDEEFDSGVVAADKRNNNEEEDYYQDVQSRAKGFSRYRPSFIQQNPRFFLNYVTAASGNPLFRTVRVTITSTINITNVQSCLAASLFTNAAAQNLACRRKREIGEPEYDLEDTQFAISPSQTQQVMPTELPTADLMREKRQVNQPDNYDVISSLGEDPFGLLSQPDTHVRGKRFFRPVVLSTVVSYTFVSTTITKSVNLASVAAAGGGTGGTGTGAAAAGPLLCRPAGYVIC